MRDTKDALVYRQQRSRTDPWSSGTGTSMIVKVATDVRRAGAVHCCLMRIEFMTKACLSRGEGKLCAIKSTFDMRWL